MHQHTPNKLPKIGLLYLDHVLRFFDKSNFKGWPEFIETVCYHWGDDAERFISEVKRKKIEVLIGNIPATAYETFRRIARALPEVEFIPSLDTQFSNKSKENVTRFCQKYDIPIPPTQIFYDKSTADDFLSQTDYPKIIKKSYGPSNYGGYFVHKVDSYQQAKQLLTQKKYHPTYVQDFVPMEADIRVMLIGHKPVCAFWRRPVEGEWLTNTSQGGSMDYQDVPRGVLDLAVEVSRAANAEYWACDIAVGKDGKYRILECATAFAAFPYIRDWIGQYLMWKLSDGQFRKPNIPLYNWEELGKIDSSLLRTMRHITFGREKAVMVNDSCEIFNRISLDGYPILDTLPAPKEEWPSEVWNFQDNHRPTPVTVKPLVNELEIDVNAQAVCLEEGMSEQQSQRDTIEERVQLPALSQTHLLEFFTGVKGIGKNLAQSIIDTFGTNGVVEALNNDPQALTQVKRVKSKKVDKITQHWAQYKLELS